MNNNDQPFETEGHDLSGYASLDLKNKESFQAFAAQLADYNPDRFDPVAFKIYVQDMEVIVTLYALDKSKQEQNDPEIPEGKLPVKKFKMRMPWMELLSHVKSFDLVLSSGAYDVKDMLVTNK